MTKNNLTNNIDEKLIKSVLSKFQEGYSKRDLDNIENYMNELFANNSAVLAIGTSRREWCFGVDYVKKLVSSDWQFWGNLAVDVKHTHINVNEETAWFISDCTLTWHTPEDFDEWCNDFVADYFEEEGYYVNYGLLSKLAIMNLNLQFVVASSREPQDVYVPMPVRLSGSLIKENDVWKINRLHFSNPMPSYPEWRIDHNNLDSQKCYQDVRENSRDFIKEENIKSSNDIIKTLNNLKNKYLNKSICTNSIIDEMFIESNDTYIVDPNEISAAFGNENISEMISLHRDKWDKMIFDANESIVYCNNNTAIAYCCGLLKKTMTQEEFLLKEWLSIKDTLQKEGESTKKLFEVQKRIAYALKEYSFGEESIWEFRLDVVLVKDNNQWKFHKLQFSYPTLYIHEQSFNKVPVL